MVEQMSQLERATDPAWLRAMRMNLAGGIHLRRNQFEEAVAVHAEQRQLLTQACGEEISLMICQNNLCGALNCLGRCEEAIAVALSTIECAGRLHLTSSYAQWQLLHAQLSLGRLEEADVTVRRAMPDWRRDANLLVVAGDLATLLAKQGRMADAARVDGAASAYVQRSGATPNPVRIIARRRTRELLAEAHLDPKDVARWQREGETLDENAIAALCLRTSRPDSKRVA